jgi:hypothetical protein
MTETDVTEGGGLSLEVTLSGLRAELHAQRADRAARTARQAAAKPVYWTATDSHFVVAGSVMVLDLGTPTTGRRWVVRQIGASDAGSVLTAVTGAKADWYVGRAGQIGQPISPAQWVAHMEVLPQLQQLSNEQITVIPNDHLFVVVNGASTVGQNVLAFARVLDYDMITYKAVTTI